MIKKLITTMLLLSVAFLVSGQDIPPTDSNFKKLQSPSFNYYITTQRPWMYMGSAYGWKELASYSQLSDTLDYYKLKSDTVLFGGIEQDSIKFKYSGGAWSQYYWTADTTRKYINYQISQIDPANVVNAYMNTFDVVSDSIWVIWPVNFSHDKYKNFVSAWITDTIEGKISRRSNAIYNYRQTVSGFGCRVWKNEGTFSYYAADTTNLYPFLADFDNYVAKSDSTTRFVTPTQMMDSIANISSTVSEYGTAIEYETPTGLINSSNTLFTLDTIPILNSERILLNGVRQILTTDYSIASDEITFVSAPITGDTIYVSYDKVNYVDKQRYNIIPTGTVNGSNKTFTLSVMPLRESINVFLNGVRQYYVYDYPSSTKYLNGINQVFYIDYGISGATISFKEAPITDDYITVDYILK